MITFRILYSPKLGPDKLFTEPEPAKDNDGKAKREMEERLNRLNFVAHFHYEDRFTPRGVAVTFDPKGNYNCGGCNKRKGESKCCLIPITINKQAGSCAHYEIECAGDREIDISGIGVTAEQAGYNVARNGRGFGCHRCPNACKAHEPDSVGRDLYCGKGEFRVEWNACCAINAAPVVAEYEGNKEMKGVHSSY